MFRTTATGTTSALSNPSYESLKSLTLGYTSPFDSAAGFSSVLEVFPHWTRIMKSDNPYQRTFNMGGPR
jgi:hypothetical protein